MVVPVMPGDGSGKGSATYSGGFGTAEKSRWVLYGL